VGHFGADIDQRDRIRNSRNCQRRPQPAETEAQVRGATDLVEATGVAVAGIATIRFHRNERTRPLCEQYEYHNLDDNSG
jgi:hypothetical protein